jgi:hypothetical protein
MTIELMKIESGKDEKFRYILENTYVDPAAEIEHPPIALSFGEHYTKKASYQIPIGSYGNFSFVQAPPKSRKSFFVSLLAAAYLGGNTPYTGKLTGHRGDKCLAHFDTEQGRYHAQRVFRRTLDMSGLYNECYQTYALRSLSPKERLEFIEWYLYEYAENLGVVILDGIADLCVDVNDIKEANEIVQYIMKWTEDLQIHIVCVIHSNFGSDKPTGHLGSFLEKKTETQIQLEVDSDNKDLVAVKCKRSRSFPFEDFYFQVTKDGLPIIIDGLDKLINY